VGADSKGIPANDMVAAEMAIFEANHQDFGAGLCEKWKFPNSFAMVTGYHHRPMEVPAENRTLTALIYVADRLAADTGMGFRQDLLSTSIDPEVLDFLKITGDKLNEVRSALAMQAKDVSGLLG
jgi:HD-like signal output (HDOD) protein